jgi:hypothetical protein
MNQPVMAKQEEGKPKENPSPSENNEKEELGLVKKRRKPKKPK